MRGVVAINRGGAVRLEEDISGRLLLNMWLALRTLVSFLPFS